jgi:hypothetical protein
MRVILVVLLSLFMVPLASWAKEPLDLNALAGNWTYAQTVINDVYTDEVELSVGEKGLGGVMTYKNGNETKQDVFSNFDLDGWGRLIFITRRPDGKVVAHTGEFSNNGNTVRGSYNLGMGVGGRFILDRVVETPPPSMNGYWEYRIINPSGGKDVVGDALLLSDSSGFFEGYLTYRDIDAASKKVKGTVGVDGSLRFEMYEKGPCMHEGMLEDNGTSSNGIWKNAKIGTGHYSLKKLTN